jgi:hypothetical protein
MWSEMCSGINNATNSIVISNSFGYRYLDFSPGYVALVGPGSDTSRYELNTFDQFFLKELGTYRVVSVTVPTDKRTSRPANSFALVGVANIPFHQLVEGRTTEVTFGSFGTYGFTVR